MKHNAKTNIESVIMDEDNVRKRTEHETFDPNAFNIYRVQDIARARINRIAHDVLKEILDMQKSLIDLPSLDTDISNVRKIETYDETVYAIGYDILGEEKEPNIIVEYYEKTDNPNLKLRLTDELRSEDTKK